MRKSQTVSRVKRSICASSRNCPIRWKRKNSCVGSANQDMSLFALPTQLFFLFQRIGQLRELAQMDLFTRLTVCDFLLEKDPLFARLTLSGEELHLYQQIYD